MGVGPLLRQSSLAGHHLLATTVENANRWRRMVNFRVSATVVLNTLVKHVSGPSAALLLVKKMRTGGEGW